MMRITFRSKLLLAMMSIVAAVTFATMLVAQRRVRANYEAMFREQYDRQISYFTALQEARLGTIREQCVKFVQSPQVQDLLRAQPVNSEKLYALADTELRTILRELPEENRPAARRFGRAPTPSFHRFINADGSVISLPEIANGRKLPASLRHRLEQRLGFVREVFQSDEVQNVAYVPMVTRTNLPPNGRPGGLRARPLPAEKGESEEPPALQEIIVTRISDAHDGKVLGVFVVGFPLPDLVAQPKGPGAATNRVELFQAGILVEDRLFADTAEMPEHVRDGVTAQLVQRLKATSSPRGDFPADIDGVPYRIFYEILNDKSKFQPAYQVCVYSLAEARAEQRALRWKLLGVDVGALVIALGISLFLAHGLSAPVRELVAGTTEVQQGNFQVRVPVRSQDELGQLAASFNDMAVGLAQKEKYRTVLNTVADERIARRLLAGELTLGGELREVAVLFCDIRGFTALTQNMPPGEIISMVNEHMTALSQVVKEHNGLLDKFVGDLLMAVFGAPERHGDDIAIAARCALRLQQLREQLNATSRHQLRIGIGLASGTAVAGCMGSTDRLHYTVLGERVNLASRLCDRAGAGEILIDDNTLRHLGDQVRAEAIGEIELKGFATPVRAFRLLG